MYDYDKMAYKEKTRYIVQGNAIMEVDNNGKEVVNGQKEKETSNS